MSDSQTRFYRPVWVDDDTFVAQVGSIVGLEYNLADYVSSDVIALTKRLIDHPKLPLTWRTTLENQLQTLQRDSLLLSLSRFYSGGARARVRQMQHDVAPYYDGRKRIVDRDPSKVPHSFIGDKNRFLSVLANFTPPRSGVSGPAFSDSLLRKIISAPLPSRLF